MKFKFKEWSLGGKFIFFSTLLAILSLFMTWVDMKEIKLSGFEQKGYIFLVFYIYPMYKLLKDERMHKIGGKASSILAIALGASLLGSISIDETGNTVNAGGTGLYLYITASILLNIGTIKYLTIKEKISDKKKKLQ
ncbi:MAG: hypothetical protein ACTHW2_10380 [Tissierella sp.]|uniref:hypothetical protein n=1 Tax=Tissierella sp. TaxID=41274 RepID=UPI003F97C8C2